jgi:P4 family phage/plasmid primase-like protien
LNNAVLETALALHDAGCCVLPAAADGSKRPAFQWKRYQQERPDREWVTRWFTQEAYQGLGVVCGEVSGGLELLELEGRAIAEGLGTQLAQLVNASGLGELWGRLAGGYMEMTPSGGLHILYRVHGGTVARNTKLARRPATEEELAATPGERIKVLIETRGEGGWCVTAPSGGTTHPTGAPWVLAGGGPATIPTITPAERDELYRLAATFDQLPAPTPAPPAGATLFTQPASSYDDDGGTSPGDDYNARTTWEDILPALGWVKVLQRGNETYWRRPGKATGVSASTGRNDGDNLYVFTTATEFEPERPYDRFGAYALLNHGGDHSAAAKALHAAGYGHRPPPTIAAPTVQPPALTTINVNGNLATVHQLRPTPTPTEERSLVQSDDGAALGLVDRFGEVIRFVPERGRWLAWTGVVWRWQPVSGGIVREYAKQTARALPEGDKAAVRHKTRALSAVGTAAMLAQAATDPRVAIDQGALDAHPWELNTPGGIVDLRTGTMGPSDASKLHTKITACSPDADADPARWLTFLADTFGADFELIGYLQRLIGYSATGNVAKHVLPFCVGSGGNGKGVFLESLTGVLGDYATTAPAGFLMAKASIQHETEIARLTGMRMVVCSEVSDEDRFDEVKVKQLTGGDTLTARFMRQDHFSFTPSHHLWLMGNHQPHVRAGGRAFWRRLRLIPFLNEVTEEQMVDDLQGILSREHGPALLAWIVAGAAAYAAGGLDEPESVTTATGAYAADQDTVARFVEECCHLAPASPDHVQIKTSKLREAYERWCFGEGETPVSAKKFTQELIRRFGAGQTRSASSRSYTGITIIENEATPSVTEPREPAAFSQPSPDDDGKIGGPGW